MKISNQMELPGKLSNFGKKICSTPPTYKVVSPPLATPTALNNIHVLLHKQIGM